MGKFGPYDTPEELQNECNRISSIVVRGYRAVEADDLAQEVFIQAWKYWDPKIVDATKWIFTIAQNKAQELHETEMQSRMVVQYQYTSGAVRKILELSFQYENWDHSPIPLSARSAPRGMRLMYEEDISSEIMKPVPDPTDSRDVCADVQIALDLLEYSDRVAIIERYKFGIKHKTGTAEAKRLSRAVGRLTDRLNSHRGNPEDRDPRGRRAMSNSKADFIVKNTWNG